MTILSWLSLVFWASFQKAIAEDSLLKQKVDEEAIQILESQLNTFKEIEQKRYVYERLGDLYSQKAKLSEDPKVQKELWNKALEYYNKALELDNSSLTLRYRQIGTLLYLNQISKASVLIKSLEKKFPSVLQDLNFLKLRAYVNFYQNRYDLAAADFQKIYSDPKIITLDDFIAWSICYNQLGKDNESLSVLEKAIKQAESFQAKPYDVYFMYVQTYVKVKMEKASFDKIQQIADQFSSEQQKLDFYFQLITIVSNYGLKNLEKKLWQEILKNPAADDVIKSLARIEINSEDVKAFESAVKTAKVCPLQDLKCVQLKNRVRDYVVLKHKSLKLSPNLQLINIYEIYLKAFDDIDLLEPAIRVALFLRSWDHAIKWTEIFLKKGNKTQRQQLVSSFIDTFKDEPLDEQSFNYLKVLLRNLNSEEKSELEAFLVKQIQMVHEKRQALKIRQFLDVYQEHFKDPKVLNLRSIVNYRLDSYYFEKNLNDFSKEALNYWKKHPDFRTDLQKKWTQFLAELAQNDKVYQTKITLEEILNQARNLLDLKDFEFKDQSSFWAIMTLKALAVKKLNLALEFIEKGVLLDRNLKDEVKNKAMKDAFYLRFLVLDAQKSLDFWYKNAQKSYSWAYEKDVLVDALVFAVSAKDLEKLVLISDILFRQGKWANKWKMPTLLAWIGMPDFNLDNFKNFIFQKNQLDSQDNQLILQALIWKGYSYKDLKVFEQKWPFVRKNVWWNLLKDWENLKDSNFKPINCPEPSQNLNEILVWIKKSNQQEEQALNENRILSLIWYTSSNYKCLLRLMNAKNSGIRERIFFQQLMSSKSRLSLGGWMKISQSLRQIPWELDTGYFSKQLLDWFKVLEGWIPEGRFGLSKAIQSDKNYIYQKNKLADSFWQKLLSERKRLLWQALDSGKLYSLLR